MERACRDSCQRLGIDYVDLYLLHFPVSFVYRNDDDKWPKEGESLNKDYLEVWREMEKLVEKGLAKEIGVCNFNAQQIQRLYDNATIKPAYHEMEFHPSFARYDLVNLCRELKIGVFAYCPLGRPSEKSEPKFLSDPRVKQIASRHKKSAAQIALRFSIQSGATPIPKSATKTRIEENIDIFDFRLTDDEMNFMKTFHSNENQICKFHFAIGDKFYPF